MKARLVFAAPETNPGKLQALEDLHQVFVPYTQTCVDTLVSNKIIDFWPFDHGIINPKYYFPPSGQLSSQILKQAQWQAIACIKSWVHLRYSQRLKKYIRENETLNDYEKMQLYCIGKYDLTKAGKFGKGTISQEMVDLYYSWVFNPEIAGNTPHLSDSFPMEMSEMTCVYGLSEDSTYFGWWLRFSTLEGGPRIQIPLAENPYVNGMKGLKKTVFARKQEGKWLFQFCEKAKSPTLIGDSGKIGLDVGLNTIAATSDGRHYGKRFKAQFDKTYKQIQAIRANRKRQGLSKDSKKLARLEAKLSGQIKTAVGEATNKLIKAFPNATFVIEDLDLKGCKGSKRFAYKALHNALKNKAIVEVVEPGYSSQMCPSCGYISRSNRSGIKFSCRSCGKKGHADSVGGSNLLGRSGDQQIATCEKLSDLRSLLRERFLLRRTSSLGHSETIALIPNSQELTTKVSSQEEVGTASNQVRPKPTR